MTEERDERVDAAQASDEAVDDETMDTMLSMDELMATYEGPQPLSEGRVREGELLTGTVVQISDAGVMVDVGMKSEGLIPKGELEAIRDQIAVGDVIQVVVTRREGDDGHVMLSKRAADVEAAWEHIVDKQDSGEVIEAQVVEAVKGGLLVDLGLYGQGFVPASHVSIRRPRNLNKYVGQTLKLQVIEVERRRKRVVLSHRKVVETERAAERDVTLTKLREGQVRRGVVRRITDFGAFVDIGGVDGLLHVSELSWKRVDSPGEQLRVGDALEVMVLKLSLDEGRISLGRRQLLADPWRDIPKMYREGQTIRGTVQRFDGSRALVRLAVGWDVYVEVPEELRAAPPAEAPAPAPEAGEEVVAEVAAEAVPEVTPAADAAVEPVVEEAAEAVEPAAEESPAEAPSAEPVAAAPAAAEPAIRPGVEVELHVDRVIVPERELWVSLASLRVGEPARARREGERGPRAPLARGRYSDRREEEGERDDARAAQAPRRDRRRDRDGERIEREAPVAEPVAAAAPPVRRTLGDLMGDKLRALLESGSGKKDDAAEEE